MTENKDKKTGPLGEIFYSWKVSSYNKHDRGLRWYFFMLALAIFLIIYSILTANFLFALIIILIVFVVMIRVFEEPINITFEINEKGVIIGDDYYPFEQIDKFFIIYDPPVVKKLIFDLKGLRSNFSVDLKNMNPVVIRKKLLEYIEEDLERNTQSFDDQLDSVLKL